MDAAALFARLELVKFFAAICGMVAMRLLTGCVHLRGLLSHRLGMPVSRERVLTRFAVVHDHCAEPAVGMSLALREGVPGCSK